MDWWIARARLGEESRHPGEREEPERPGEVADEVEVDEPGDRERPGAEEPRDRRDDGDLQRRHVAPAERGAQDEREEDSSRREEGEDPAGEEGMGGRTAEGDG